MIDRRIAAQAEALSGLSNVPKGQEMLIVGRVLAERKAKWEKVVADNGGIHPNCGEADTRLLNRMRRLAVPAIQGSGMHPDRQLWVNDPREPVVSSFEPTNKYR